MRKFSISIALLSLAAGTGGFALRRYELATAFEPPAGLAIRGAAATLCLGVTSLAFVIAAAILAIYTSRIYRVPEDFDDTFTTSSAFYLLAFLPICLMWSCGTIIQLLNLIKADALQTVDIYFTVLSALSALCIAFFAVEMFQDPRSKSPYILSVVPIAFLCFWLILLYRENAANPVLLDFVYLCFAIVFSALSFYYTAGFLYGKPSPGRATVVYFCCIYFNAVALADNPGTGIALLLGALIIYSMLHLLMLLRNMIRR